MRNTITGLLFLASAGLLAIAASQFDHAPYFRAHKNTFSQNVAEDLEHMRAKKLLPDEWGNAQYATYTFESEVAKKLVGSQSILNRFHPSGPYKIDFLFIDLPDDENPSVILQMSIFDIASNNKVWELGKNYPITSYLKKNSGKKTDAPSEEQ